MSRQTDSQRSRFLSPEFLGEVVLLAFVGWFFAYMLYDSIGGNSRVWLLPRIAVGVGIPFWIWRVAMLFRTQFASGGDTQIMDVGFLETDDSPDVIRGRWIQFLGSLLGLFVGLWVFGYHIGLPLWVAGYLMIWGKTRWWWAVGAALFFEVVIIFIYDNILLAEWNRPLVQPIYDLACSGCDVWIWGR